MTSYADVCKKSLKMDQHGASEKYTILDNFYTFNPCDNWKEMYSVYHAFPENIDDIIKFVGRDTNILEVGSGAGIIASRLAHDGNINMTCTDTDPPDKVFHECYMIENPFEDQQSVKKKCIDGNIIEDYKVPNFDALLLVWPPMDGQTQEWYKPEKILEKALEINKNLKVIVIGEYSQLSNKCTKEDNNLLATGTFEFWKLLKDSFEEVENIENLHKFNHKYGYFGYDSTTFYKPKQILSTFELKERYENLLNKFDKLKEKYKELKEKYKLTDTYTQSESFIPKENNYLDDKEYKNLKCYFENLKYNYRKIYKLNNI
jgi:hypothetical protein